MGCDNENKNMDSQENYETIELANGNKIKKATFFKNLEGHLSTIGLPNWTNEVTPLNEINLKKLNREIELNNSGISNLLNDINRLNDKIDNGIKYISDIRLENNKIYLIDNKGNKLGDGFEASLFYGQDGRSLEYNWSGTSLGIRKEGDTEYSYAELKGQIGTQGKIGDTGLSAYDSACATGFKGSESEWILSLKGHDGKDLEFQWNGTQLGIKKQGDINFTYVELKGRDGEVGIAGLSAYEIAVKEFGFVGDELQWIASLKGAKGERGDGIKILATYSSYNYLPNTGQVGDAYLVNMDLYVYDINESPKPWANAGQIKGEKGDTGLTGRQGQTGDTGKSAYNHWIDLGNSGSREDFINALKGSDGKDLEFEWNGTELGVRKQGEERYRYTNLKGERGLTGTTGTTGSTGATGLTGATGATGKSIEYNWSGTELGIRQEGTANYSYVNLKGEKGERGDGINILGSLSNESELPNSGKIGDAYLINGSLYVYDSAATPKPFINVGNIKGEKGTSAYDEWIKLGNSGSEQDFINSLKGKDAELPIETIDKINKHDGDINNIKQDLEKTNADLIKNTNEINAAKGTSTSLKNELDKRTNDMLENIKIQYLEFEGQGGVTVENSVNGVTKDLVVEGQTLVNLLGNTKFLNKELTNSNNTNTNDILFSIPLSNIPQLLKASTEYTFVLNLNVINSTLESSYIQMNYKNTLNTQKLCFNRALKQTNEYIVLKFTMPDDFKELSLLFIGGKNGAATLKSDGGAIILEGDYTNKPIPAYFEGIKSVGDQEENKISILSIGKNILDLNNYEFLKGNDFEPTYGHNAVSYKNREFIFTAGSSSIGIKNLKLKPNTSYITSYKVIKNNVECGIRSFGMEKFTTDNTGIVRQFGIGVYNWSGNGTVIITDIQLEEGTVATTYEIPKKNKKDILLPFEGGLKAIGDIKDIIDFDKKKAIEKIGKIVIDGSDNEKWEVVTEATTNDLLVCVCPLDVFPNKKSQAGGISSNFACNITQGTGEGISLQTKYGCYLGKLKSKLETPDVAGFKKGLQANPTTVYYKLTEPIVHKFTDIHVSNLKTYFGKTYVTSTNSIESTLKFKTPKTLGAIVDQNTDRISENSKLIEEAKSIVVNNNVELEEASGEYTSLKEKLDTLATKDDLDDINIDLSDYYNKLEVDNKLINKAEKTHIHSEFSEIESLKTLIGNTTLPTSNKTITGAISELFQNASNGKTLIANAITGKGVDTNANESFRSMSDKIEEIKTGYDIGDRIYDDKVRIYNTPTHKGNLSAVDGWCYGFTSDSQGNVVLALGDSSNKIRKIKSNGEVIWSYNVVGGNPYSINNDNGNIICTTYAGRYFYKLNNNGKIILSTEISNSTLGAYDFKNIEVYDNSYVLSSAGGYIYKTDNELEKTWEYKGHTKTIRDILIDISGNIYSGSDDMYIKKTDKNGASQWSYSSGRVINSVCIENQNKTIMYCADNYIYGRTSSNTSVSSLSIPDGTIERMIALNDGLLIVQNKKYKKYRLKFNSQTSITYEKEWEHIVGSNYSSQMLNKSLYEKNGIIYCSYNDSKHIGYVDNLYFNCIEII